MKISAVLLLLLLVIPALTISCRQAEPLSPQEPVAVLLEPGDGSTLTGTEVKVRIYLQNFNMVENTGQPNKANEGHAIYYLDVTPPLKQGMPAITAPGTFVVSTGTSYIWSNLPPGEHTFSVQLVHNDDTPLYGPVTVRANVMLKNR